MFTTWALVGERQPPVLAWVLAFTSAPRAEGSFFFCKRRLAQASLLFCWSRPGDLGLRGAEGLIGAVMG